MPFSDQAPQPPLVLAGGRVIDPSRGLDQTGDVLIENGAIRDIAAGASAPEGAEIVDCRGRVVAPGLVDLCAFIGEPGAEHRETIASASRAAAAGGVTSLVCTPETDPPVDDPAIVDFLLRRARDTAIVRVLIAAAITKGLHGIEMTEIGLLKEAGAVAFTDGARSIRNARVLRRVMTYARDCDALIMHHTEDADLVGDGVMNEGEFASRLGLAGRPVEAETIVLERDIRLARLTGASYHAVLATCRDSLDIIRRAKDQGLPVSAGTSINHLSFNETDIGDYRTFFKFAPPLRGEDDRKALAAAIEEGLLDVIMSDHVPQDVEQKRQPFAEASDGAVGLETMLVAGLRLVHSGDVQLINLLRAMSTRPAALLGLDAGTLRPGAPADVIVIDLDTPWVLDPERLRSRSRNTPFDEARLQGRVLRTIVAGRTVFQHGDAP